MPSLPEAIRGSSLVLCCVLGVGLALPALGSAIGASELGAWPLTRRLLVYELALLALGLATATAVCACLPGRSPAAWSLGMLDATVGPVPWLGLGSTPGVTWRSELSSLTLAITCVTTAFAYFGNRGSFSWAIAFANIAWILLFAAINAAAEEWLYRVALLRAAEASALSSYTACVLSALVFGAAHFGGMPGGWSGSLAAALLGFVLSRATLETGGIASAWAVHFVQDIVIFGGWLGAAPVQA